jgi:hypothetical protein
MKLFPNPTFTEALFQNMMCLYPLYALAGRLALYVRCD